MTGELDRYLIGEGTHRRLWEALGAHVERDVHLNPNAQQQELWLRDPDGYLVVLAGPSPYRPR